MVRILHVADLHLGWEPRFLGPKAEEWQRRRDDLLTAVVDYAVAPEHGIDLVLIVGDLFDTHKPGPALVNQVEAQLRRLVEHRRQVVTVPGNHDEISYPDSVYRQAAGVWPGILVQNPQPDLVATLNIRDETCYLYSLAYTGGLTRTDPPIADFPCNGQPGWHIAAFHGSLNWNAGDRSLPLVEAALGRAGYNYVALGHIHKRTERVLGRGVAVYPGGLAAKGWSDPGTGRLTVATLSGSGVRTETVVLDHPGCCTCRTLEVDAGMYGSAAELTDGLKARLGQKDIACVHLTGSPSYPVEPQRLQELLAPCCYYLEVRDETAAAAPGALEAWAREATLRGYFVRRMKARLAAVHDERERRLVSRALTWGLKALGGEAGE
ncbi:MAG TPA: DNA repair exonuclease [Firmicutes bacterium]|jgi:predicted phosphodiesterase|nr:hypothetical protein [Bacillota bacterium]HHV57449.1 DNA repair exonuclease [Bacillota bacterium]